MDWEAFYNAFRRPDFIPGYEIENRLGGGAFGDVYKARKSSIGKPYAIKFLKVENDDQQEAVERELDQVRHFASIDHPNLVTIEDLGVVKDVPYLIMGYAGEETLARRFKRGDLGPEEALRVFVQASRGVLALHERSIVHFDLKPSNVFLRGESARVGDYGLSKLLDSGRMTLSFGRGTPMYMAPEMLRSRADHRADIYSLGVILFEALTGRLPFRPDEHGGLVLRDTDEPPEFPDGFPSVARPAVEGCLRLDPDDRFGSVVELLDALGQTARPGDSVVFTLAPHERERPVADADPPSTRRTEHETPTSGSKAGLLAGGYTVQDGEDESSTEIDPGSPAGRARLLVRELRARAEAAAAEDGPRPASISVIPVPPKVTGGLGSTMLETIRVGFDVFLAVIVAVTSALVGGFRYVTDHLVRSQRGGALARALRFAVFLLIMVGVGFGATLVGMFGLFVLEQAGSA